MTKKPDKLSSLSDSKIHYEDLISGIRIARKYKKNPRPNDQQSANYEYENKLELIGKSKNTPLPTTKKDINYKKNKIFDLDAIEEEEVKFSNIPNIFSETENEDFELKFNQNKEEEIKEEIKEEEEKKEDEKLTKEGKPKKKTKKKKKIKFSKEEEENYQRLVSETKNYIPFEKFNIEKYLLTDDELNKLSQLPELFYAYKLFYSNKLIQDKIYKNDLLPNIKNGLISIYNHKNEHSQLIINDIFKDRDTSKFEYTSSTKSSQFDLFVSFALMSIFGYESIVETTSIQNQSKIIIPLHALAYIYSSKMYFYGCAKLIRNAYNKSFGFPIIRIYDNQKMEYQKKLEIRQIIWKMFEATYKYFRKNNLISNIKMDDIVKKYENKIYDFAQKAFDKVVNNVKKKHEKINVFNLNDEKIQITKADTSAPYSAIMQTKFNPKFQRKFNIYKYYMEQIKVRKMLKIDHYYKIRNELDYEIKNNYFKDSLFYKDQGDIVNDFLNCDF